MEMVKRGTEKNSRLFRSHMDVKSFENKTVLIETVIDFIKIYCFK